MESPPPAVFHDKAKRTQEGDLLHERQSEWRFQCTCKISICKEFDMIYASQCNGNIGITTRSRQICFTWIFGRTLNETLVEH